MSKPSFRAHISKSIIDRLQPGDTVWDTELKGFGARRQTHSVSYIMKAYQNGRQKWRTIGKHGQPWTPSNARKRALEIKLSPDAAPTPATGATVTDLVIEFREHHYPKLKPRTRKDYDNLLDRVIIPAIGSTKVAKLDRRSIGKLHADMRETPRLANYALAILSKLMSWAEQLDYRTPGSNPCTGIKKYREQKRERFLTLDELSRLANAISQAEEKQQISKHAAAAIRLLIFTGARLSEILTLEWSHVDFDHQNLWLPDSKTGQKTITLNEQSIHILRGVPRLANNIFVIVGKNDGAHMVNLGKPWTVVRELAGLTNVRLHDLRHSFASVAAAEGASLQVIGKLLGHSQPATTARYAHLTEGTIRDANSRIGNAIAGVKHDAR